jgi:hypothetical protein
MCVVCWITKATDTHSKYWIMTAFLQEQWLCIRISMSFIHTTYSVLFIICILHRKGEHFDGGLGVVMLLKNLCLPLLHLFKPSMKIQHPFSNKNVCILPYRIWQTTVRLSVFLY